MDLTLSRFEKGPAGVFSHLLDALGTKLCESVTHAYQRADGQWEPKVPVGRWLCLRGMHSLDGVNKFETFAIAVPGHTNLLFHKGNVEEESLGCELLGMYLGHLDLRGSPHEEAVLDSKDAFDFFMKLQTGVTQFWLTVEDAPHVEGAPEGMASQLDDEIQRPDSSTGDESGHGAATGAELGSIPPADSGEIFSVGSGGGGNLT